MADMFERGFSVRETMWHGKGITLQEYPGKDEAKKLAGHDHQIVGRPLMVANGDQVLPLTGWKALQRSDNGTTLNVVKDTYEVIQNDVPWDLLDAIYERGAKWETAGVLSGRFDEDSKVQRGSVYWVLSLLNEPKKVKLDDSLMYPYLMATWGHGDYSLRFRAMSTRVVCANTHHAAMHGDKGADLDISIRHFGKVEVRIEKAKQAIELARKSHDIFLEMANELSDIPASDKAIAEFIEAVIPLPEAKLCTDRVRHNVEKARADFAALFNGQTIAPAMRNTVWGMVEAGVEYMDHLRRSMNSNTYFTRNLLTCSKAKASLIETAKEIALAV